MEEKEQKDKKAQEKRIKHKLKDSSKWIFLILNPCARNDTIKQTLRLFS